MLTVTVTPHGQGGMKVVGEFTGGKYLQTKYGMESDPGALAAIALQMAMSHNNGEYVIVGPKAVMEHIPEPVRCKIR